MTACGSCVAIQTHRKRLQQTPHWIIDVRRNDGGSDATYGPIVEALIGNPILLGSAEFLATLANIEGHSRICGLYAPDDAGCRKAIQPLVEALRAALAGTYVRPPGSSSPVMRLDPDQPERARPQRVAVLTDAGCASSCGQWRPTIILSAQRQLS